ncbi:hypothetical protein HDU82_002641 [Entophlyctis luteolus]|nr:hypothetical protein HDU82_002641 [Entophlyctis luteolus]
MIILIRQLRQGEKETAGGYEILGVLILVRLATQAMQHVARWMEETTDSDTQSKGGNFTGVDKDISEDKNGVSEDVVYLEPVIGASNKCILCLETRKDSTSTPRDYLWAEKK